MRGYTYFRFEMRADGNADIDVDWLRAESGIDLRKVERSAFKVLCGNCNLFKCSR